MVIHTKAQVCQATVWQLAPTPRRCIGAVMCAPINQDSQQQMSGYFLFHPEYESIHSDKHSDDEQHCRTVKFSDVTVIMQVSLETIPLQSPSMTSQ